MFLFFISGKSRFMQRLIQQRDALFTTKITYVIWCYSEKQPDLFNSMKDVDFHRGLSEDLVSESNLKGRASLIVIDDLAQEVSKDLLISLYTKFSHHRSLRSVKGVSYRRTQNNNERKMFFSNFFFNFCFSVYFF